MTSFMLGTVVFCLDVINFRQEQLIITRAAGR